MKKIIIILLLFVAIISLPSMMILNNESAKTYSDGWEVGYVEGYCYQIDNCNKPSVPQSPVPNVNRDTYQDGYNDGFIKGKKDKK